MSDPSLFAAVDDNVRGGTAAFVQTMRLAKRQVAENRPAGVAVTEKLAALLLAAQYESRLHWLLTHPDSRLQPSDVGYVRRAAGLSEKWHALLRVSFAIRKTAASGRTVLPNHIPAALDQAERARYYGIRRTTVDHLSVLIDLRNSLAHGEWMTALTRKADSINAARTARLKTISLYRVVILSNMLDHLWKAHLDALVTHFAFERDFDRHYNGIVNAARRLEHGDEGRWLTVMRRRYKSGRTSREALSAPPPIY